jgi:F-type H+-transporting ATPase subunit b
MLANTYPLWILAQILAVAILVFLFLRWRPGFTGRRTIGETLGGLLEARAQSIREQLEGAEQSREEATRIHERTESELQQARQEGDEIVARAAHTSAAIQRDLETRAREEYQRIVAQARVQIEYEREQAETALRRRAADIVVDAARQVVERNLDPQTDRRLIAESLNDRKEVR